MGGGERRDVDRRRVAAWRYRVAQDEWNVESDGMHDYTRLQALEDRGQRWAIAADVGFGLAAATAVTAVILFATGESSERAVSRSPVRAPRSSRGSDHQATWIAAAAAFAGTVTS